MGQKLSGACQCKKYSLLDMDEIAATERFPKRFVQISSHPNAMNKVADV